MASTDTPSERDALVNRILPEMVLSDGSPSSNTAPPATPANLTSVEASLLRFQVTGAAVIVGGAGTLALSSARALLEHGLSRLIIWDLPSQLKKPEFLAQMDQLQSVFPSITISGVGVDVTSSASVQEALATTLKAIDRIDVMCYFAGVVGCTHVLSMSEIEWSRTMDVNCKGAFLCAQAITGQMAKQNPPGGSIVLVASISGHSVNFPQPQIAYNTSKAAVLHLTRSLAAEVAVHGIRVNSISPGYMNTILNHGAGLERARNIWASRNPMGRMGEPSELQGTVVLLCSRAGSYINGTDIVVDGGGHVF